MSQRIEVQTPFGTLFAEVSGDPEYPGIYICLDNNGEEERQLALAECVKDTINEDHHTLRVLIWEHDNDDYSHEATILKNRGDSRCLKLHY